MIPSPPWKERAEAEKKNKRVLSFSEIKFRPTTCLCPKGIGLLGQKQVVGRSKKVMG